MNLIEESFQNKEEKKRKKLSMIIIIAIIVIVISMIGIVAYIMYLQSTTLKLTLDGQTNEKLKDILVFDDDGTIYAPIKEIAQYFGYESYNGEYSEKTEDPSKCYVINENEVVNFELSQNKIYKLDLTTGRGEYEYSYIKKPVKAIGGLLCVSSEGLEKAFNLSFVYDKDTNRITIWTMPYLYSYYSTRILDEGYTNLDREFVNQKCVLRNMLIVEKRGKYGVIKVDGTIILEPKYDDITYLVNTGDFLIKTNGRVGIVSATGETRVESIYDSIELMDSDAGLYVVKKDNRYGVIDIRGNVKIYIENDEIGYDISGFPQNNIKNKYILADSLIPVKKNGLWALYDKNGNQLTDYKYDSFGYKASNNRDALNLLFIPDYNVLIACKDRKYTLVNSTGSELFAIIADDIYMTISGGERHYYIAVNDQQMDAIEYLKRNGITVREQTNSQSKSSSTDEEDEN